MERMAIGISHIKLYLISSCMPQFLNNILPTKFTRRELVQVYITYLLTYFSYLLKYLLT